MKMNTNNARGGAFASKKLLAAFAVLAVAFSVFAGVVAVADNTDAADTTYISGDITDEFDIKKGTIAVIDKDLNIKNSAIFTVESGATLTINEGVKVTVDGKATQTGGNDSEKAGFIAEEGARIVIDGQLIIGENGAVEIRGASSSGTIYAGTFVSGSVNVQKGGDLVINAQIMNGGSVSVSSAGAKVSSIGGSLSMMSGSTVSINGKIANEGLKVIASDKDSSKEAAVLTSYAVAGVTIEGKEIDNATAAQLSNLTFTASSDSVVAYHVTDNESQKITAVTSALSVSGSILSATMKVEEGNDHVEYLSKDGEKVEFESLKDKSTNGKDLDLQSEVVVGSGAVLTVAKNGELEVAGNFDVAGSVNVVKSFEAGSTTGVAQTVEFTGGTFTISGSVDAAYASFAKSNAATLIIDGGKMTLSESDDGEFGLFNTVKGAYYAQSGTSYTIVVCELEDAIAAANGTTVTGVTVSGTDEEAYAVSESFSVPANVTLTVIKDLTIGEDYVMTVPANAVVDTTGGMIIVSGKLIDESYTLESGSDEGKVKSNVVVDNSENAVRTFTSLKIAIADAVSGDVITLANDTDVSSDMTIPGGVEVVIGDKNFTVKAGATLTVAGVLNDSKGKLVTDTKTNSKAAGKVVVDNYMIVSDSRGYDGNGFNVAGIYAGVDAESRVMSITVFASVANEASQASLQGKIAYDADITFVAGDSVNNLNIEGTVVFNGTITLVGYQITITENGIFTAKVATGTGAVALNKVKGTEDAEVVIANNVDDEINELTIAGTPAENTEKGKAVSTIEIVSGTLVIGSMNAKNLRSFGVAANTTLQVDGDLQVADMIVNGVLAVSKDGAVAASGNITVLGTVTIDPKAQKFEAESIYLGIESDILATGAAAAISGENFKFTGVLVVAYGSSVDDKAVEDLKKSVFTVGGSEWVTVYANADSKEVTFDSKEVPVTNADFEGWVSDGDDKPEMTVAIGKNYTAVINENIYTVTILADNGIGTVAIDGNVLLKSSNMFVLSGLKAGSHKITYELKNGYEGTDVVIKVNDVQVTGGNFTLSGTGDDDRDVDASISGTVQKSYDPQPTPDPTEDDGMGITDYLLIVLVVLIVILAVIVAMRLMRS